MGKVISWLCLIWNAIGFLLGALFIGLGALGAASTHVSIVVIVIAAGFILTGPGLAVATALVGARIIRNRAAETQVERVFE